MARPLRFEYPGAIYHVMARGDGGKQIFLGREDCESFLHWLERVCRSHGWRAHAWVLMGNPAAMSQLVNRMRKTPDGIKAIKKHEKIFKSKD